MTDKGWKTLVAAAPHHVDSVRNNFVDVLTADEYAALGKATAKIVAYLSREDD